VTIFDYDKIQDRSTYEQPVAYPDGIPYVLVNGEIVIDKAQHTGAKPGSILFGQGKGLNLPLP
jgi:N-acyl-D-amino-acid deacylase